jgi:hypothetical protein
MNQEKVKQLLIGLGADDNAVVNAMAILSDGDTTELPFKALGDFTEAINKSKEELYISKHKDSIINEYEEATKTAKWLSYERPLINAVKRAGGFDRSELEGLNAKEAIALLAQRKDAQLIEHSNKDNEEYIKKINELQTNNQDYKGLIERLEEEKIKVEQEANERANQTIYSFHAEKVLNERIYSDSIAFDIPEKRGLYKQLIVPKILESYKINSDGTILAKDGTKALSFDRNGFYSTVDEAIKDLAKDMNILKVSNGGNTGTLSTKSEIISSGGKKVDSTGLNFLTQHLNRK